MIKINPLISIQCIDKEIIIKHEFVSKPIAKIKTNSKNAITNKSLSLEIVNELCEKIGIKHAIIKDRFYYFVLKKSLVLFKEERWGENKYFFTSLLSEEILKYSYRFINLTTLRLPHFFSSEKKKGISFNIVIYNENTDILQLNDAVTTKQDGYLLLVKVFEKEIIEIGPFLELSDSFCFSCLSNTLNKVYPVFVEKLVNKNEMVLNEFVCTLIDNSGKHGSLVSSILEKKMIFRKNHVEYTSRVNFFDESCSCYE
ncbi:hypothetical protein [Priestia aryabhattai]